MQREGATTGEGRPCGKETILEGKMWKQENERERCKQRGARREVQRKGCKQRGASGDEQAERSRQRGASREEQAERSREEQAERSKEAMLYNALWML
jgi:hypothetical protein